MRTSVIQYFLFFSLSLAAGVSSAEIFDGTSSSQSSNTPVADPVVNHAQPFNPGTKYAAKFSKMKQAKEKFCALVFGSGNKEQAEKLAAAPTAIAPRVIPADSWTPEKVFEELRAINLELDGVAHSQKMKATKNVKVGINLHLIAWMIQHIQTMPMSLKESFTKILISELGYDQVEILLKKKDGEQLVVGNGQRIAPELLLFLQRHAGSSFVFEIATLDEINQLVQAYQKIIQSEAKGEDGKSSIRRRTYALIWLSNIIRENVKSQWQPLVSSSVQIGVPYRWFGRNIFLQMMKSLDESGIESRFVGRNEITNTAKPALKSLLHEDAKLRNGLVGSLDRIFGEYDTIEESYIYREKFFFGLSTGMDISELLDAKDKKNSKILPYLDYENISVIQEFKNLFDEIVLKVTKRAEVKHDLIYGGSTGLAPSTLPPVTMTTSSPPFPAIGPAPLNLSPSTTSDAVPTPEVNKMVSSYRPLPVQMKPDVRKRMLLPAEKAFGTSDQILVDGLRKSLDSLDARTRRILGTPESVKQPVLELKREDMDRVQRVVNMFEGMKSLNVERSYAIEALMRTYLAQGAILLMGPPGATKSKMATMLGTSIVDQAGKTSYFQLQMAEDTSKSETHGGIIQSDMERGVFRRNYKQGVLGSFIVFLDEFFDARLKFIRGFLSSFSEREYAQGGEIFKGVTKFFIAATNHYINEIYQKDPSAKMEAIFDRFNRIVILPKDFDSVHSTFDYLLQKNNQSIQGTFQDMDRIHELSKKVEVPFPMVLRSQYIFEQMKQKLGRISNVAAEEYQSQVEQGKMPIAPYMSSRIYSGRTLLNLTISKEIPTYALVNSVKRRIAQGENGREVQVHVTAQDVDQLLGSIYCLQGPDAEFTQRLLKMDYIPKKERKQYEALQIEKSAYDDVLKALHEKEESFHQQWKNLKGRRASLGEDLKKAKSLAEQVRLQKELENVQQKILQFIEHLSFLVNAIDKPEELSAEQVAAVTVLQDVEKDLSLLKTKVTKE